MSKDTHTHRGHCQYCLRVIAIDVTTGKLAKHGYNVRGGMFIGQCPGSEVLSLHVDRSHTDNVIELYKRKAVDEMKRALELETGVRTPYEVAGGEPSSYFTNHTDGDDESLVRYWRFQTRKVTVQRINPRTMRPEDREIDETVMIEWADANEMQKRRGLILEIREAKHNSESAASFAKTMTKWAAEIFGTEAYLVDDLENWAKVGDMVHAGGKKNGFDAKVEAAEMMDYTTFGYRQGRNTIKAPHVQITRPAIADTYHKNGSIKKKGRAVHTYWEAVRNLQPAEGSLMARLKADDLI